MNGQAKTKTELLKEISVLKKKIKKLEKTETAYKQVEAKLRESEARYRTIIETIQDGYVETDITGNMIFMNDIISKHLGYSREELIGKKSRVFQDKVNYKKTVQIYNEIYKTGKLVNAIEMECIRKDGTIGIYELSLSMLKDAQGKPIGFSSISRNITERKKMEDALKESEKRYRMIVENMHDSITTLDMNFKATYTSPSEYRLTGFTPEEAMQLTPKQLMTPESRAIVKKVIEEAFIKEFSGEPVDPNRSVNMDLEVYHKKGHTMWQEVTASFNRDEYGKPVGIMLVSRDITERKKMEAALRESEKSYRMIVEHMREIILTTDFRLQYTYVSPSSLRLTGYAPEEMMSIPLDKLLTPDSFTVAQNTLASSLGREFGNEPIDPQRLRTVEVELYHKNGGTIWLEITASFTRDETGKAIGILIAGRDITERKKMEAALKESEEKYRMIVENMHDVIWTMDMNLNYTYISPSEVRISGYTPDEAVLIPPDKAMTPESYAVAAEIFAEEIFVEDLARKFGGQPLDPHRKRNMEMEICHKNGDTFWQETTISFIRDESGKPTGVMFVGRDITERKQAERDLQTARDHLLRAEKLSAIGQLSAGVAHEILNPVNIISIELQLLQAIENMPHEVLEELNICLSQIDRIVAIANGLKQLTRITEKKMDIANINSVIAQIVTLHTSQLMIDKIVTEVQYHHDLPEIVMDQKKIEQVILNLISNARGAMEGKENKVLRITTDWEGNHDQVRIMVADTGNGIKNEHMLKLFNPFFTTKEHGKGTGLGLSISYGIINDHGGRIWAENNEWGGASFYISLPVKPNKGKNHL